MPIYSVHLRVCRKVGVHSWFGILAAITSSAQGAVDASDVLTQALDDFENNLRCFPFVDTEVRQNAISGYEMTSEEALKFFLQTLSQQVGIRKEGILRLTGFINFARLQEPPHNSPPPLDHMSKIFGVLKTTLIAGHHLCGDLGILTTKFDRLSEIT